MKVLTVVGARPQFVKAAVVSHAFAGDEEIKEVIVHTGQHYDRDMSQSFFDELDIPRPLCNLGVSGGTHAGMTARMLVALEGALGRVRPDCVLVYGDTNSTLAGALASAKMGVPVVHVEAGPRCRLPYNPEEINRVCTDHISALLLACTERSMENLAAEGLSARARFVGDPMYDAFLRYREKASRPAGLVALDGSTAVELPPEYYYLTCHREENTADPDTLEQVFAAADWLGLPVVYPVHPRAEALARGAQGRGFGKRVLLVKPVGYLESVYLVSHAEQVITDSGGLQREAFFAQVKCTTILPGIGWPETFPGNRNIEVRAEKEPILEAVSKPQSLDPDYRPFGDGRAAERIVAEVKDLMERSRL